MSFPEKSLLAIPRVTHTSSLKQVVRLFLLLSFLLSGNDLQSASEGHVFFH